MRSTERSIPGAMRFHDLFRRLGPVLLLVSLTTTVAAQEPSETPGWAFSAGVFDTADRRLAEVGVQYRFRPFRFFDLADLTPMVGVSANEEGGFWAFGGLRYDWRVGERWIVTPSFAVTLYEQGDGIDLGQTLEFRSSLEITRRLRTGARFGAAFYHLSNASLSDTNPGSNSFVLVYSFGR